MGSGNGNQNRMGSSVIEDDHERMKQKRQMDRDAYFAGIGLRGGMKQKQKMNRNTFFAELEDLDERPGKKPKRMMIEDERTKQERKMNRDAFFAKILSQPENGGAGRRHDQQEVNPSHPENSHAEEKSALALHPPHSPHSDANL